MSFNRAQRRWIRDLDASTAAAVADPALAAAAGSLRTLTADRPAHVVVVPQEGEDFGTFCAGTRNLYWEAGQSLSELTSADRVSSFTVPQGQPPQKWHRALIDHVHDSGATHVITHIESDPGSSGQSWTWDVPGRALAESWDGVLLGVLFDSAWPWIEAKSRYLARLSPRFMAVDICMPMDGQLVKGRPEVGPVNMPLSEMSLGLVDERLAGLEPEWDLSFIGAMYPYRQELVERLRASGISVAVNPHRHDDAEDYHSSRTNQPEWLDYMAGLRSSRMTLNFSRSSAGPIEQLKTRVIEATLARTVLLTDDRDRTRLFWTLGEEYEFFETPDELPRVVHGLMDEPRRLDRIARAGEARAREVVRTNFWGGIDRGLRRRGLPPVLDAPVG